MAPYKGLLDRWPHAVYNLHTMKRARIETPLKRVLEDEGRTQAWIARRLGVSRTQVGFWVHGINIPTEPNRVRIADLLGRTADELWPDEPDSLPEAA